MDEVKDLAAITRVRRTYNKWVANETLEDFALRFTARRARKWSTLRVSNTAIGSISFLALEAIGGALTLSYGQANATAAILIAGSILFLTGLPIAYHAARAGVDIDLLTRGAGFGYLGSTITSLIYASFTFLFFALEAAILSQALLLCFGIPLAIGYLLNAIVVLPLVTHGFTRIGQFQAWSQPAWVVLQLAPFAALIWVGTDISPWFGHEGRVTDSAGIDPLMVAAATGVALALIAQIGEQVDFLRFLPEPKDRASRRSWWIGLLSAGPGWAVIGTLKMLAGSLLAVLVLDAGGPPSAAAEPTQMYLAAFGALSDPTTALLLTGIFVVLAQLKINVTNAYAGSIAWSNFFSRLTHSHPGRVVWLVFNVAIALMLMEFGVFGALEHTLSLYALVAVAWIGTVTADLTISMPLGLRPRHIEFRRAYLFDINPVGVGSMTLATIISVSAALGVFGATAAAWASLIALATALVAAPAIAWVTGGRYYLARTPPAALSATNCIICEHHFDGEDMVDCPFHDGPVCSLCCSLESRCGDRCKPEARIDRQFERLLHGNVPDPIRDMILSRYGRFVLITGSFTLCLAAILFLVYQGASLAMPDASAVMARSFGLAFGLLSIVVGVAAWLFTLTSESRDLATRDRERQSARLMAEIRAHRRTDAELAAAKEAAEAANEAKSRYLIGITHELRSPLNAIFGYAQLLESDPTIPEHRQPGLRTIRQSSEHLSDLIEGLLDVSKIEAGRVDVYRDHVTLPDLLEQISGIMRMEAAAKGLNFIADFDGVPDRVVVDERRLRQILINLLSNAVRYTDHGEVRFSVKHRNEIATITVSDTGCGVRPEDVERIFDPFQRIVTPGAPSHGTGLGLTITKLLVELLGGDIQLDSQVGRGSTFTVRLFIPRRRDAQRAAPTRRRFGYRGKRRTILVVDDNPAHRALLADALRPLGFDVAMAETAETALVMVAAGQPDLALVDVLLPGMSGWTLAAELRRGEAALYGGPIVMISAHAADQRHAGEAGVFHDDFLSKPVNLEALMDRLERLLKLDWIYDDPAEADPRAPCAPTWVLDALDAAVATGHLRAAETALSQLDTTDPAAAAFAKRVRAGLDSVDLAAISALVAEARHAG